MDIATLEKFLNPETAMLFLAHMERDHKDVYAGEPTPKHAFLTLSLDRVNGGACTMECNLCGQALA